MAELCAKTSLWIRIVTTPTIADSSSTRSPSACPSLFVDARYNTDAINTALANDRRCAEAAAAASAGNADVDVAAEDDDPPADAAAAAGGGGNQQQRRRKRWWHVWAEWPPAAAGDGAYATCLLPPEGASAKQPHSTRLAIGNLSNLQRHFKESTHHKAAYDRLQRAVDDDGKDEATAAKEILDKAEEAFRKRKERTPFKQGAVGSKAKKMKQEIMLLSFFVDQGVAFNAVDNEFFHEYHDIYQWSSPPNRRRLADVLLPYAYERGHEWLVEQLKEAHYFSIITDAWTSATLDKFVALNICFVSDSWKLKTITLAVIPLNESHTWQTMTTAIARRVNAALPEDAVLVTTVTDNGANFIKLARSLHANLPIADINGLYELDSWDEPVDVEDESTASWRCVAHKTQLAVNDVIGEADGDVRSLIERVRTFTRFMRASNARRMALKQAQLDLGMPQKVPTLDVATRWSAVFYMLERFYLNYDAYALMALRGAFDDEVEEIDFVTPAELVKVKGLVDALAPVEKFIRLAEGEKYVSLAVVPVYYSRCMDELLPQSPAAVGGAQAAPPPLSSDCIRFRRLLRQALKTRLDYILERPNLALAAAALHPQYGHLQFVGINTRNAIWRELEEWIVGEDNAFPAPVQPALASVGPVVLPPAQQSRQAVRAALRRLREGFEDYHARREAAGEDESIIDPLEWWARNSSQLPDIQHIAKIVFCVPATSAASERVFSSSGVSATSLRARLDVDKVEMMTVLRSVLHMMGAAKWRDWLRKILAAADDAQAKKPRLLEVN